MSSSHSFVTYPSAQACRLIVIWLIGLFLVSSSLSAHYLNMTRAKLSVDGAGHRAELHLQVDLTKMIGSPFTYHELSQSAPDLSSQETRELSDALLSGLIIQVDGQAMSPKLESFVWPSLALQKFTEPWAAPMAALVYSLELPLSSTELKVRTDAFLKIEYPFVLTLQTDTPEPKSVTRWLEPGQSSPRFGFMLQAEAQSLSAIEDTEPSPSVSADDESVLSLLITYLILGFEHIIPMGFDHILFILGLFFLSHRWRPLLLQASIFTLAHTITLLLSSLDWVVYRPGIVEPLIALSIVYVGIENVFNRKIQRGRIIVVFVFGLIHGMGFANMFSVIDLPAAEVAVALVCFNLGVEFGQVAVLAVAWLCLRAFFEKPYYRRWIQIPCSLAISVVAAYWFFERVT